jgi:hypothetical protein
VVPDGAGFCRGCGTILVGAGAQRHDLWRQTSVPRAPVPRSENLGGDRLGPAWGAEALEVPHPPVERAALGAADALTGLLAIVSLASLFMPWFTVTLTQAGAAYLTRIAGMLGDCTGGPICGMFSHLQFTAGLSGTVSALDSNLGGDWRYVALVSSALVIGYLFLRLLIGFDTGSSGLPHWQILTALALWNAAMMVLVFTLKPASTAFEIGHAPGAYVGLGAALIAVVTASSSRHRLGASHRGRF